MAKRILITFSGDAFSKTTRKIVENATKFGADEVRVYDDWWIMNRRKDFYEQNRWAFDHPHKRGFGWYIWKPFVILDALNKAADGDIVMFTDADTYPVKDFSVLYDICDKSDNGGMFFTVSGHTNRKWCKRDCFIVMNQDEPRYHDAPAAVARFMLFKKGVWPAYQLLLEWLTYSCNKSANTFDKSVLGPELSGFTEHRCEQAILTNLIHKHGFRLYRDVDQSGDRSDADRDIYPTLFHHDSSASIKHNNLTVPCLGSEFRNVD